MDAIMPITRGITWNHAPKITRLRDSFCHITNRWLGYRHFAETSRKHGGCHIARNLAIWRAKTRHFRAEESCNGISAAALHREFCAVYFRFNPSDKEDRMYTCCRRRWKVLHARSNSDYSENGSRKWGMRTYVCVLLHELKGLLEKATGCLVVSEGCLYMYRWHIYLFFKYTMYIWDVILYRPSNLYILFFSVLSGASCLVLAPPTW